MVAASVEEANINYHGPTGRDATNMRGRSKITFKKTRNILEAMELEEDNVEQVHRISYFRKAAGDHTAMRNKLINVARTMKANARNKEEHEKVRLNHSLSATTMEEYSELADNTSGRKHTTPELRNGARRRYGPGSACGVCN